MNVGKKLRKFIFLNVFAMMGMSCYILADTFFISVANGTLGIAALNLTLPVYGLLFAIGSLIGIGSATRYSLCKMTDNETSRLYFSNAVMFAVLIGIGFTLLGNFFPAEILKLMGADADILSIGTEYLQIAMLFSPFFIANYTFTAFVRNDNAPNIAMAATLLSSLFNIVFDYVFMFPMHMGMRVTNYQHRYLHDPLFIKEKHNRVQVASAELSAACFCGQPWRSGVCWRDREQYHNACI